MKVLSIPKQETEENEKNYKGLDDEKRKKNHMEINLLKKLHMGIDIWENMLKNSNTKLLICSTEETLKKQEVML